MNHAKVCLFFLLFISSLHSNIIHIQPTGNWGNIQAAIDTAYTGDTLLVHEGTYYENLYLREESITLASLYIIDGDSIHIKNTILDGSHNVHVDSASVIAIDTGVDSTTKIIGFTIQNGYGGGIRCMNSSPTLSDLIIKNNAGAIYGGGIWFQNSCSRLKNLDIRGNNVWNDWTAYGGGLSIGNSDIVIENSTISMNEVSGGMGGARGGGIYCNSSNLSLIKTLINDNYGEIYRGGGLCIENNSKVIIINATLMNNASEQIYSISSQVYLVNSIVWSNIDDIPYIYAGNNRELFISHSDVKGGLSDITYDNPTKVFWLEGNISNDPQFVGTGTYDYRLQETSLCIDAGIEDTMIVYNEGLDSLYIPKMSYRDNAPDMGALEYLTVDVVDLPAEIIYPETPLLNQNYPNPFNPITTITFKLPRSEYVLLKVYNTLGETVKTLINKKLSAGDHSINFNGVGFGSGVYLYKLQTSKYVAVKKMVYLK